MQQLEEYLFISLQAGSPVGIASASSTLLFTLTTGITKKLLNLTRKKRKSMIRFLWRIHEEFITILNEKDKYEKMKDNLRDENEKYEIMRLSSVKSKI